MCTQLKQDMDNKNFSKCIKDSGKASNGTAQDHAGEPNFFATACGPP